MNQNETRQYLIGRSFKPKYTSKNYVVDDISFDRNVRNVEFIHEGHSITLAEYYLERYHLHIRDVNQPLIIVRRQDNTLYFIPELCHLCGIDDDAMFDRNFFGDLSRRTRLIPNDRVDRTNEFLDLIDDDTERDVIEDNDLRHREHYHEGNMSAARKRDFYGLNIEPVIENFRSSIFDAPIFEGYAPDSQNRRNKKSTLTHTIMLDKWIFVYHKNDYNNADKLYNTLYSAAEAFSIIVEEPEWIEMSTYDPEQWIAEVDDVIRHGNYKFVLYLIKNANDYRVLKTHSLCTRGYISQVVKISTLFRNIMSVCSKILLQINAKLGGATCNIRFENNSIESQVMVVGIDTSHIGRGRTGIAMVATLNRIHTSFYNREYIISEPDHKGYQFQYNIKKFLVEAIQEYFRVNRALPRGVIIYRQGVSLQQKNFLQSEVGAIDDFLNGRGENNYLHG